MGHEFMGIVEELGSAVKAVRAGDRVVVPFSISCGHCEWCRRRLPTQCTTTGRDAVSSVGVYVEREKLQPARIITHTLPLKDTPHGDAIFDRKEDRAIKVMLEP